MNVKIKIGFIKLFIAISVLGWAAKVNANPMYCSASQGHYGDTYYISTVFDDRDEYNVGISNSFSSYVSANFVPKKTFIDTPICTRYPNSREANDDRNNWISKLRRDNHEVVIVNWSY